ncbi:hypothetical protein C8J56DRAFT_887271 [Mycena floridula]|nr:hypothetical protein C8J56DRAFT_887271 [Mycena floridula]
MAILESSSDPEFLRFQTYPENDSMQSVDVGDHFSDHVQRPLTSHPLGHTLDIFQSSQTASSFPPVDAAFSNPPIWNFLPEPTPTPEPEEVDELSTEIPHSSSRPQEIEESRVTKTPLFLPSSYSQSPSPSPVSLIRYRLLSPDFIESKSITLPSSSSPKPPISRVAPTVGALKPSGSAAGLTLKSSQQNQNSSSQRSTDVSNKLWNVNRAKLSLGAQTSFEDEELANEILRHNLRFVIRGWQESRRHVAAISTPTPQINGQQLAENYAEKMSEWFESGDQRNQFGKMARRPRVNNSATPPPTTKKSSGSGSVLGKRLRSEESVDLRRLKRSRSESADSETDTKIGGKCIEKWTRMFNTLIKGKTALNFADVSQMNEILEKIIQNSEDWQWVSWDSLADEDGVLYDLYQSLAKVTKLEAIPHSDQVDLAQAAAEVANMWQEIAASKV